MTKLLKNSLNVTIQQEINSVAWVLPIVSQRAFFYLHYNFGKPFILGKFYFLVIDWGGGGAGLLLIIISSYQIEHSETQWALFSA